MLVRGDRVGGDRTLGDCGLTGVDNLMTEGGEASGEDTLGGEGTFGGVSTLEGEATFGGEYK